LYIHFKFYPKITFHRQIREILSSDVRIKKKLTIDLEGEKKEKEEKGELKGKD
jgi:hypothetical protein